MPAQTTTRTINLKKLNVHDLKKVNWRELWRSRQLMVYAVLLAIASVCIAIFAVIPTVQKIFEVVELYQQENEALQQLQKKIAVLEQVSQQTEYQRRDQVEKILPNHKPLLELLTSVNAAAQATGVQVTDIETSPGKLASGSAQLQVVGAELVKTQSGGLVAAAAANTGAAPSTTKGASKSGIQPLAIEVTIRGTLATMNAFIDEIERSVPITNVSEIELDALSQRGKRDPTLAGQFEAKMMLNTYYFTKVITSTVSAPLPTIGAPEREFLNKIDQFVFTTAQTPTQIQGGGSGNLFKVNPTLQQGMPSIAVVSPTPPSVPVQSSPSASPRGTTLPSPTATAAATPNSP